MTAYDTGSSGFNMAVAIGQVFKTKYSSDMRVLPAGNDVARLAPLKAGRALASAMGIGTYFAQEGVFEFAVKEWGPQPLQLILASTACNGVSLGVAKDTGVKEVKDMKGKRIGIVVGSPALNQNALAMMAFGGVEPRPTSRSSSSPTTARCGRAWSTTRSMPLSPRPFPARRRKSKLAARPGVATDAGRRQSGMGARAKVAPYFVPHKATCGAGGIAKDVGRHGRLPVPDRHGVRTQPADLVYSIAKAMIDHYRPTRTARRAPTGFEVSART